MDLIAPIVPNAQENKGPELFLQALGQGLQAFSRFAEMRRQSESDVLRLATQERMAQQEHELGKQKLDLETEMRGREMAINEALLPSRQAYFESVATTRKNAAGAVLESNRQREHLVNDVNNQARKLKLDDPVFATKEPVQFAANVNQFEDMFRLSPLPEIKNAIKQYRTIADQQKINLRTGVLDDETGEIKASGSGQMVPIWQIVKRLQDPTTQEETMNALTASGHLKTISGFEQIAGQSVPSTKTELTEGVKSYLEKGRGVKFERVPSRVPSAMLPKSAAVGTSPTELPEPDLPAVEDEPVTSFTHTETDIKIAHAKAAIARGAPKEAVAQRLQEMGIDPQVLSE